MDVQLSAGFLDSTLEDFHGCDEKLQHETESVINDTEESFDADWFELLCENNTATKPGSNTSMNSSQKKRLFNFSMISECSECSISENEKVDSSQKSESIPKRYKPNDPTLFGPEPNLTEPQIFANLSNCQLENIESTQQNPILPDIEIEKEQWSMITPVEQDTSFSVKNTIKSKSELETGNSNFIANVEKDVHQPSQNQLPQHQPLQHPPQQHQFSTHQPLQYQPVQQMLPPQYQVQPKQQPQQYQHLQYQSPQYQHQLSQSQHQTLQYLPLPQHPQNQPPQYHLMQLPLQYQQHQLQQFQPLQHQNLLPKLQQQHQHQFSQHQLPQYQYAVHKINLSSNSESIPSTQSLANASNNSYHQPHSLGYGKATPLLMTTHQQGINALRDVVPTSLGSKPRSDIIQQSWALACIDSDSLDNSLQATDASQLYPPKHQVLHSPSSELSLPYSSNHQNFKIHPGSVLTNSSQYQLSGHPNSSNKLNVIVLRPLHASASKLQNLTKPNQMHIGTVNYQKPTHPIYGALPSSSSNLQNLANNFNGPTNAYQSQLSLTNPSNQTNMPEVLTRQTTELTQGKENTPNVENEQNFSCPVCGCILREHKCLKHICHICRRRFVLLRNLRNHFETHSNPKKERRKYNKKSRGNI